MALTKLLESTLDESWELKNMPDERLRCLTKSLLSQNFYGTMFDLSKTFISHPVTNTYTTALTGKQVAKKVLFPPCLIELISLS